MVENVIQIKSEITINADRNVIILLSMLENPIWNPIKYAREIDRYLKSIADDLVITCDEIIDVLDVIPIN